MKKENKKKIEDFLNRKLERKELDAFQKELNKDKSLLEDTSEEVIKKYGRIELQNKLEDIHFDVIENRKRKLRFYVKIAASIALLASVTIVMYFYSQKNSNPPVKYVTSDSIENKKKNFVVDKDSVKSVKEKIPQDGSTKSPGEFIAEEKPKKEKDANELLMAYYEPYQKPSYRGNNKLDNAYRMYSSHMFDSAYLFYTEILKSPKTNYEIDEALFFTGLSILADSASSKEKELKAVAYFQSLISDPNSKYNKEAQWYLSLLYIKMDKIIPAKEILGIIVDEKSYNHKKGKLLLEEL